MLARILHQRMLDKLYFLYGEARTGAIMARLEALMDEYAPRPALPAPAERVSERDVLLITYGDLLWRHGESPLATLYAALASHLSGVIGAVHILPFFPYSSDDGFSVIDYLQVDPALGTWDDIHRLNERVRLMFDAVINHISAQSGWFAGYLAGDPAYADFFIEVDPSTDLSEVVRPRTLPLLTPVQTVRGEKHVWTTFSADQVDLNYASETVLLAVIKVLLEYVRHGAGFIRLDAIAYLWKQIGTSCIHLPQTHTVVQLLRDVLDAVAPDVLIITETNVPHRENVSYFGDGSNEAQLVYQFSLPPLVVHSFLSGDAVALTDWAAGLETLAETTTFFNFTASHDGIGVRPVEGLLSAAAVQEMVEMTLARGGQVSYKANSDGSQSPYELNITYFDAINDPYSGEDQRVQVDRFIASQAIMLAFVGVPGIYFHSLLGSRNWIAGVEQTGRARTVNREKLNYDAVRAALADPTALRHQVFTRYSGLIRIRAGQRAFHPNGRQDVLRLNRAVLALLRTAPAADERILALHNVAGQQQRVTLSGEHLGTPPELVDLLSGEVYPFQEELTLTLMPYQVMWLKMGG